MAINWPVASYTGQLYTSPNNNIWRWNGYAWDIKELQSSGTLTGPWVIFDPVWRPKSYATISDAMDASNPGDVIYLTRDTGAATSFTGGPTIKDGININLNGNTFRYTFGNTGQTEGLKTAIGGSTKAKIQNGKIEFLGATSSSRVGIRVQSENDEMDFTGLSITSFYGLATLYSDGGSINGGSFYNQSTNPNSFGAFITIGRANWPSVGTDYQPSYFTNIEGYSSGGAGVLFDAYSSFWA